jgi:fatty-acyl-CoA synthase
MGLTGNALAAAIALAPNVPEALRSSSDSDHNFIVIDRDLNEQSRSYRDLMDGAAAGANMLRDLGVTEGDRVCLLSSTSLSLINGLLATWWAGAVPVILPLPRREAELPQFLDDLRQRLDHVEARLVMVMDQFAGALPNSEDGPQTIPLGMLETAPHENLGQPAGQRSGLAYLQFTSGTTARSRAVALTHTQMLAQIASMAVVTRGERHDVVVHWLPLFHDMGLIMTLGAIAYGARVALLPPEEFLARPAAWMDAISRYGGTFTVAPNFAYGLAARDLQGRPRDLELAQLRIAGNGAEPIDADTMYAFAENAAPYGFKREAICPMYGLAEATLAVATSRPGEPVREVWVSRGQLEEHGVVQPVPAGSDGARRLVACGPPVERTEVAIVAPDGEQLPPGRVGEILVRSPSVMSSYWRDPDATQETIDSDGWLHTGDLGFVFEGELVVCGRIKDMIVVGGRNLYPEDYEQCAVGVDGVRRGNVIAFGLPEQERMVVVAETRATDGEGQALALKTMQAITSRLSHAPQEVILVPPGTLPKTSSGKVQRGVCRQRYLDGELPAIATAGRQ